MPAGHCPMSENFSVLVKMWKKRTASKSFSRPSRSGSLLWMLVLSLSLSATVPCPYHESIWGLRQYPWTSEVTGKGRSSAIETAVIQSGHRPSASSRSPISRLLISGPLSWRLYWDATTSRLDKDSHSSFFVFSPVSLFDSVLANIPRQGPRETPCSSAPSPSRVWHPPESSSRYWSPLSGDFKGEWAFRPWWDRAPDRRCSQSYRRGMWGRTSSPSAISRGSGVTWHLGGWSLGYLLGFDML